MPRYLPSALAAALLLVGASRADSRPAILDPPEPLEDLLDESRTRSRVLEPEPDNPHIIDIPRMLADDCRLDRMRGGSCVLRPVDDEVLDVSGHGTRRAKRYRYQLLEQIIDSIELLD